MSTLRVSHRHMFMAPKSSQRHDRASMGSHTRLWSVISTIGCLFCLVFLCQQYLISTKYDYNNTFNTHEERAKIQHLIDTALTQVPESVQVNVAQTSKYDTKFTNFIVPPSKPLLCVVFQSCSATGLAMFINNTCGMEAACDWAIQCYNEIPGGFSKFMCARLLELGVSVVHCAYTSRDKILANVISHDRRYSKESVESAAHTIYPLLSEGQFNNRILPKPLLYTQIQYLLSSFTHVWLLDEDISFDGFDVHNFLDIARCSYYPYPSPLVIQPLIAGNTQVYKYLNQRTWAAYADKFPTQDIRSIGTGFIEIQAPFMHAGYFNWYLDTFVKPVLVPVHTLGADWGFDCLLCRSATHYAIHKLQWEHHEERVDKSKLTEPWKFSRLVSTVMASLKGVFDADLRQSHIDAAGTRNTPYTGDAVVVTDTPACAIVVKNTPLHHFNDHMMDRVVGRKSKIRLNRALMKILKRVFPAFYQTGGDPLSSPLSGALKFTAKVGELDPKCLALYS